MVSAYVTLFLHLFDCCAEALGSVFFLQARLPNCNCWCALCPSSQSVSLFVPQWRVMSCRTYSSDPRLQAKSVEKLQDLDFLHVLPGHGRRAHFKDAEDRKQQIQLCLSRV